MNRRQFFRRTAGVAAGAAIAPLLPTPAPQTRVEYVRDPSVEAFLRGNTSDYDVLVGHARRMGQSARLQQEAWALEIFRDGVR